MSAPSSQRINLRRTPLSTTAEGERLPGVWDLLRGRQFYRNQFVLDVSEWVRLIRPRLDPAKDGTALDALSMLASAPKVPNAVKTIYLLERVKPTPDALPYISDGILRCRVYAAFLGCRASAQLMAAEAARRAGRPDISGDEAAELVITAAGWMAASIARDGHLTPGNLAAAEAERISASLKRSENREATTHDCGDHRTEAPGSLLVLPTIGNHDTQEGRRVRERFQDVEREHLPFAPTPNLSEVRQGMLAEFPYAERLLDDILTTLAGRDIVALRPTLLVGEPGSGKTSFCVHLLEQLAIPHVLYPCGGASDPGTLAGAGRRWTTGEPSLPMALIRAHRTASPGIVLDEVEKIASGKHNGNLHDALLGMLEPRSARRWMDPFLESEVDLSGVIWLATANTTDSVPKPFLDRCRIMRFPTPRREHLHALATSMMHKALVEAGRDPRWVLPLDGTELEALAGHWSGGSLRRLARFIDGILAARELGQRMQ